MTTLQGVDASYSASGYMAEYNLDVTDKIDEYQEDMYYLRNLGWISQLTRSVIISFSVYNFDYDRWVSCDIIFTVAPSGAVTARTVLRPFLPKISETIDELTETYIDYARLVIIFYIGIFVGMSERHHKIQNHKAGCWYHISTNGICDIGAVACMFCAVVWRSAEFTGGSTKEIMERVTDVNGDLGFFSFSRKSYAYGQIMCVEGLLMVFLMLRMMSFFRLNRTVYLLWHTLGNAMKAFFFLASLFVPTVLGFIIVAHTVYGPYLDDYSTVTKTVMQFYRLLEGDLAIQKLMELDVIWTTVLIIAFYIIVSFWLLNVFVSIVVDAYYVVQVTHGTPGDKWSTSKKFRWVLPGIIVNIYQSLTSSPSTEGG